MTKAGSTTDQASKKEASASKASSSPKVPLDDIMIAMDVVDTLRHDRLIVDRELNETGRHDDLIKRLREIYKGQGIEVPDHILEEGVKALKEDRFVYAPPKDGLAVKLARLYVSRDDWGRYVTGGLMGLALAWGAWYFAYERPRGVAREVARVELSEQIPAQLRKANARIKAVATDKADLDRAQMLMDKGVRAASSGNRSMARQSRVSLLQLRDTIESEYTIRIVTRKGELSGLWRIPKTNRRTRNYYLIVEAVDHQGRILKRSILSEETGKRELVSSWAVRVPRLVLKEVQADKRDDGIIQDAIVATKQSGKLDPFWRIQRSGGAITRW